MWGGDEGERNCSSLLSPEPYHGLYHFNIVTLKSNKLPTKGMLCSSAIWKNNTLERAWEKKWLVHIRGVMKKIGLGLETNYNPNDATPCQAFYAFSFWREYLDCVKNGRKFLFVAFFIIRLICCVVYRTEENWGYWWIIIQTKRNLVEHGASSFVVSMYLKSVEIGEVCKVLSRIFLFCTIFCIFCYLF